MPRHVPARLLPLLPTPPKQTPVEVQANDEVQRLQGSTSSPGAEEVEFEVGLGLGHWDIGAYAMTCRNLLRPSSDSSLDYTTIPSCR